MGLGEKISLGSVSLLVVAPELGSMRDFIFDSSFSS